MELHHYRFELNELAVEKGQIERLMGYEPGESPDPFPSTIQETYNELAAHCSPQGGFVITGKPEIDLELNQTRILDRNFHTDRIVTRMLRKSEQMAVFVCTAGPGIETWTKEVNRSGDMVKGFVIDAFGSEVAEAIADKLHRILRKMALKKDKGVTNRYSPGYCGWPVKDQQELFSFFPEQFCGITLSASSLMHPIKSVSGMVGMGSQVRYQMYTCDTCKDENCIYRRLRKST